MVGFTGWTTSFIPLAKHLDFILSPLLSLPPAVTVALLSFVSTLIVVSFNRLLTNSKEYKLIRNRSKELKEKMIEVQKRNDKEEMEKILDEMMRINNLMMKNTIKTLVVSFVVAILILPWLSFHYSKQAMFVLPVNLPVVGNKIEWFVWYVIVGFIFSLILNKLIGVKL